MSVLSGRWCHGFSVCIEGREGGKCYYGLYFVVN